MCHSSKRACFFLLLRQISPEIFLRMQLVDIPRVAIRKHVANPEIPSPLDFHLHYSLLAALQLWRRGTLPTIPTDCAELFLSFLSDGRDAVFRDEQANQG
jgi:hypothetical protein